MEALMTNTSSVQGEGVLSGKLALVTGGTRGIGRAIAQAMATAGARVIVTGRSDAKAKAVADELAALGGKIGHIGADLADDDAVGQLIPRVAASFGKLDILVNNAGIDADNLLVNLRLEDWRMVMKVNLEVPFRLGVAAASHFLEKGAGAIINIASILGFKAGREAGAYVPAKHGLIGLTKQMAFEWSGQGIRVNAIAPGLIKTDMTAPIWSTSAGDTYVRNKIPARRIGQPEDIAGLAVFLASDAASFIHGETILVDGGGLAG
jgi:NAD(P)-dependent dehydrogenase (short-subunit alcohol dehydrogenase family)